MAEGDVAAGGEDGIERVAGRVGGRCDKLFETEEDGGVTVVGVLEVKIQVAEEDVVCKGKGVGADYVGDGLTELWPGAGGSVDKSSSEGGVGVDVNLEM
ncbi:hypothetical protein NDU88_001992 [Pleurodeles waltl]|uniref:Uncharacterized protein n=1 Tax=Pleurodeles waltl TaxID=8319 RepID=A0AAV7WPD3_PLEWA|nr:hypothetical protein NDU88_001992 [Pleurodeles waltl]